MGPELLIVSAALQAFQGFQAYQSGKDQAKAAQQAAARNQQVIANQAAVEKRQTQREQSAFLASQRVRAAGSGATIASFEDTFEESKQQSLLDIALIDYDAKIRGQNALYQGDQQAYSARAEGRQGLISGLTGAATTGVQGFQAGAFSSSGYNPARSAPPRKPAGY